jgi:hypothetical protein
LRAGRHTDTEVVPLAASSRSTGNSPWWKLRMSEDEDASASVVELTWYLPPERRIRTRGVVPERTPRRLLKGSGCPGGSFRQDPTDRVAHGRAGSVEVSRWLV